MEQLRKQTRYFFTIEHYRFLCPKDNPGLRICYAIVTNKNVSLIEIDLKSEHEDIGVTREWRRKYQNSNFFKEIHSLEDFLNLKACYDWNIVIQYKDVIVSICGRRDEDSIGLSYVKEKGLDIEPLLKEVEKTL